MAKAELDAFIMKHLVTMSTVFVPWSQSRHKDSKHYSLNWVVTLQSKGRVIFMGDYSAGEAHCPSHKWNVVRTVPYDNRIKAECETGFKHREGWGGGVYPVGRQKIEPDICNVLSCVCLDAGVVDYASFEDWTVEMGYDPDSRKAFSIYNECLKTGLKLRAALGDEALRELQEACQDY